MEQIDGGVIFKQVLIMAVLTKCVLVLLGVFLLAECIDVAGEPKGLRLSKSHQVRVNPESLTSPNSDSPLKISTLTKSATHSHKTFPNRRSTDSSHNNNKIGPGRHWHNNLASTMRAYETGRVLS